LGPFLPSHLWHGSFVYWLMSVPPVGNLLEIPRNGIVVTHYFTMDSLHDLDNRVVPGGEALGVIDSIAAIRETDYAGEAHGSSGAGRCRY
jgi:hypothetical protein